MKKNIDVNIRGIKCDFCTWNDMSVSVKDYPKYLNKPCPYCGANLLTEADYANCKAIIAFAEAMNKLEFPNVSEAPERTFTVQMNGTGSMKISEITEENLKRENAKVVPSNKIGGVKP